MTKAIGWENEADARDVDSRSAGTALVRAYGTDEFGTTLAASQWELRAAIWAWVIVEWSFSSYAGKAQAMEEAHRAYSNCRKWAAADRSFAERFGA